LKRLGARPFIVPAMGSHGGATPEGQLEVLAGYGVTPQSMDVPFDPSMETVLLGSTATGMPLHWSRAALRADAVLPVNRVKVHTDFHGEVESGLSKMLAIGFGKQKGAATVHRRGFDTFDEVVPETARLVLEKVNVLGGVASVENALEDVAHLEVVPGDRIASREPELLRSSRSLMPRIPFDRLDVLVVDYLGKDISGMGMDPNVTGRYAVRHIVDPRNPKKLAVLRLTELTHGNARGGGEHRLPEDMDQRGRLHRADQRQDADLGPGRPVGHRAGHRHGPAHGPARPAARAHREHAAAP
jgi:hypothetical protein